MIHVASPIVEPPLFDARCRQQGINWLALQAKLPERPRDFWSDFRDDLREGFGGRCGYYAMWFPDGQVDHFISWDTCKNDGRTMLAYEWSNFRFIAGSLNSKKRTLDGALLDPFEVENSWFDLALPDLILTLTDQVPAHLVEKARFTLNRLELEQGRRALSLRWEWYDMYRLGELNLPGLRKRAPLVAQAVEKWEQEGHGPLPLIPRPVAAAID